MTGPSVSLEWIVYEAFQDASEPVYITELYTDSLPDLKTTVGCNIASLAEISRLTISPDKAYLELELLLEERLILERLGFTESVKATVLRNTCGETNASPAVS